MASGGVWRGRPARGSPGAGPPAPARAQRQPVRPRWRLVRPCCGHPPAALTARPPPTCPPQSHVNHWGCTTYYLGAMDSCHRHSLGLYRGPFQQGNRPTWGPQPLLTWRLLT